ncbi:MAG: hypothetical protein J6D29_04555 [Solobacterium sp.]|nr:hypothetical protein [Solobacterium sp.]
MSKSILIIDTPKECWDCPLHMESWDVDFEEIMICNAEKLESHYGEIPNYCPLKPMPQKKNFIDEFMKVDRGPYGFLSEEDFYELSDSLSKQIRGYNFCIDEILDGQE